MSLGLIGLFVLIPIVLFVATPGIVAICVVSSIKRKRNNKEN